MLKFSKSAISTAVTVAALAFSGSASALATFGTEQNNSLFGWDTAGTVSMDVILNKGLYHHLTVFFNPQTSYNLAPDLVSASDSPLMGVFSGASYIPAGFFINLKSTYDFDNSTQSFDPNKTVTTVNIGGPASVTASNSGYDKGLGDNIYYAISSTPNVIDLYIEDATAWDTNVNLNDYDIHLRFTLTTAPIPEPASMALAMAGLGVMGAVARRRRNTAV
jgi:hypothetical protein